MTESAFISFYDEDTQQVKICVVPRARVQAAIDRALTLSVPPDVADHSDEPITDEDARKLGCMALLCHAKAHPDLRDRLKVTTEAPMDWTLAKRPPE